MTLVRVHRAAQITLPPDIQEAARLREGDYLEAEVTGAGAIILRPVSAAGREPTPEQGAEILAAGDARADGDVALSVLRRAAEHAPPSNNVTIPARIMSASHDQRHR